LRLLSLVIEGFGVFRDLRLPGNGEFGRGLTVLAGPNESGKSTLLAFLRRLLYGFPDARSKENPYPPLSGGRHGGRILVSDETGRRIWIERFSGSKGGPVSIREDRGAELPGVVLPDLLGHVPAQVFRNVFAFTLQELAAFETLAAEGIRERIYSAGLGTAMSPAKAADELATQKAELLKSRGKARMNDDVAALKEKRSALRAVGDLQGEYDRLSNELAAAEEHSARLAGLAMEKQEALLRAERLVEARPHFVILRSADEELASLGGQPFPEAGLERYNRIKDKLEEVHNSLEEVDQELARNAGELARLDVDEVLLGHAEEIESLRRDLGKCQAAENDLPKRETELKEAEEGLRDALRDLGPDWTEGEASGFDLSIPRREEIRRWKSGADEVLITLHDAEIRERNAEEAVAAAKRTRDVAKDEMEKLPKPAGPEDIAERRQAVRQLRTVAHEVRLTQQQEASFEERLREKETERQGLAEERELAVTLPKWPAWVFALAGFAGAATVAIAQLPRAWGAFFLVSGMLVAGCYAWLSVWLSKLRQRTIEIRERRLTRIDAAISGLRNEQANAAAKKADLSATLEEPLKRLGLRDVPPAVEIERLDAEMEEQQRRADQWKRAQAELTKAEKQLQEAEQNLAAAVGAREEAAAADRDQKRNWEQWLRSAGLPTTLSPDGALEFLTKAESARSNLRRISELRHRVGGIKRVISDYLREASAMLQACGRPEEASVSAVDRLVRDLEAARDALKDRQNLRKEQKRLEGRRSHLLIRLQGLEAQRGALFRAATSENEEDFLAAASRARRRAELDKELKDARRLLETLLGSGDSLEQGIDELGRTSPEESEMKARRLNEEIEQLRRQMQGTDQKVGELRQQVRGVETDERASRLRAEIKSLEEDLLDDGHRWAILTLARAILRRTQQKYERERRPRVIEEAEGFFGEITGGRYRVVSPVGEARIELESNDGKRKTLEELSTGTAEPLYLSLRFGYICELGRQGQPLPVIMDEVLVDFDPERARGAARGIARLADSHQVLLFTCHPETVALLHEVAPQIQVCRL